MSSGTRRRAERPPARYLRREPLEYTPSSTTTINTDRLPLDDPNFYQLRLNYFQRGISADEAFYLDAALWRFIGLPAVVVFALPLVFSGFGFVAGLVAILLGTGVLVFSTTFLSERRLANAGLALLGLSFLVGTLWVFDGTTQAIAGRVAVVQWAVAAFCAWVAMHGFLLSMSHWAARPGVARWTLVVAHWRAPGDEKKHDRLLHLLNHPALTRLGPIAAWAGLLLYARGLLGGAGIVLDKMASEPDRSWAYGLSGLALLFAYLVGSDGAKETRTIGLGALMKDTFANPAPGMWRSSPVPASTRRAIAILAIVLMHVAVGLSGRWSVETPHDQPMFRYYATATSQARQDAASANQTTADVATRVLSLASISSTAMVFFLVPFLDAWRFYNKIEDQFARHFQTALTPDAAHYMRRLHSSNVRVYGPDFEAIRESRHIYAGFEPFQRIPVLLDRRLLHEHCYIVGDSGSGKTSLGLMPLITNLVGLIDEPVEHAAVVVLDLKGDMALFGCTRDAAEAGGRAFMYFTPELGRSSHFFNPFADIGDAGRSSIQIAELLLDALALNHGEGYGRSYYSRKNRDFLLDALSQKPAPTSFEELYVTLARLAQSDERRYRDAFELLATIRALTFYPQLNVRPSGDDVDSWRTIHMPTVLEEGQVAYFWLPSATESVSVREIGKLVLYSLLSAAVSQTSRPGRKKRVYLVIDEFQRLAGENFKVVLEQARSFGVGVILANQSMSELETSSGDLRSVVRSNTRVKMHFSVQSPSDLKDISELSGLDAVMNQSRAISTPLSWMPTVRQQQQETIVDSLSIKPRLTSSDILAISDHPRRFVLHVTRGSGLTQFGGRALPVEAEYIVNSDTYEKWLAETWPVNQSLITSPVAPTAVDTRARQEVIERQRQVITTAFDEVTADDGFGLPE